MRLVKVGNIEIGGGGMLFIAGPCVIESEGGTLRAAEELKSITQSLGLQWIFKSSFDKANRTGVTSFRGPGLDEGLRILEKVKRELDVPVLSDIHLPEHAAPAADVLDVLQIPAFLCRQTDLLVAAGQSGKPVNVKKGQFVAPEDMKGAVGKVQSTGNDQVLLTERGSFFGYHNLVVDMRSLQVMRSMGVPVLFDATHSVQRPSAGDGVSAGDRHFVPGLTRSAVAMGVDGLFMEVHACPDEALCDGKNMWPIPKLKPLLKQLMEIHEIVQKGPHD